jgi:hypothetical protein
MKVIFSIKNLKEEREGQTKKTVLSLPLLTNKRWPKVRFFGNFIKSDQYKKHIARLLLQLLEPKRLLAQPFSRHP